ncbi:taste receptor type 2 member 16 [Pteropus medius]|uniref:taste receptor type 2 member 16 n=1 Tax=Pteropus vampyrus TaxID=132908 RepID=UPI00196B4EA4|nr:taste receptor type 2 member 16 [Pteropus giganteus]
MIPIQLTVFFMVIYALESLTIIVQSSLIVAVLGREWMQIKRMSPVDMVFISLGFCRFCQQWSSVLYNFCSYFNPNTTFWYIAIIWEFTNTLTFWLTSLLAIVYCVKVSSFTHPVFLWLKWRILRLVPQLLLGSLLISCVAIILSVIRSRIKFQLISMMHLPGNNTVTERIKMLLQNFLIFQQLVLLVIPFLLFLASTISLIASLCQHLGQMQRHNIGHCNSSLKAHFSALRYLAFFLIFFTSYFLAIFITIIDNPFNRRHWFWAWETVIYAVVSIHSTLLMMSSPKLKKVLKVRCWGLETA